MQLEVPYGTNLLMHHQLEALLFLILVIFYSLNSIVIILKIILTSTDATVGSPTSFSDHFYSGLLSLMDGQTGTIIDSVVFPVADNVLETVPQLVATPNGEFAAIVHLWKDFGISLLQRTNFRLDSIR